jgi:GH35 family endo-1,4-beta-xylanase
MRNFYFIGLLTAFTAFPQSLLPDSAFEARQTNGSANTEIVSVDGQVFTQALRIETAQPGGKRGDASAFWTNTAPIATNERLRISFWVRKTAPADRFNIRATLRLEEANTPPILDTVFPINTDTWTFYAFDLTASKAYDTQALTLSFLHGQGPQTYEIGDFQWTRQPALPPLNAEGEPVEPVGDWARASSYFDGSSGGGSARLVPVEGQSFTQAMRITTNGPSTDIFRAALSWPLIRPTTRNDVMHASFWIRRISSPSLSIQATAIVERNGGNFSKSLQLSLPVETSEWQRFEMPFRMDDNYVRDGAVFRFQFGAGPQVFEIADVKLLHYGTRATLEQLPVQFTYPGRNAVDAPWKRDALSRIEADRKVDLTLSIIDSAGNPVKGATVAVQQLSQAFRYGSAITAAGIMGTTADDAQYRSRIESHFNTIVFENDLKWPFWEASTSFPQARTRNAIRWFEDRNIPMRGHVLVWPSWRNTPADLQGLSPEALRTRIDNRIRTALSDSGVSGKLYHWDVLNEPYDNFDIQGRIPGVTGVTASPGRLGNEEALRWFELARQTDPNAKLFLNDYNQFESGNVNGVHLNYTYAFLQFLKDRNAPVDGFGFQSHFGTPQSIDVIDTIVKRYADSVPYTFAVSEFDVNTPDEAIQADFTRDFMTYIFSQSRFEDFLMWGFWERRHWLPRGAMYRADWSSKPNAIVSNNLLFRDWWTDISGESDEEGKLKARVFKGTHQVTVRIGETVKVLNVDGTSSKEIQIDLP